jgi:hypothetical protein
LHEPACKKACQKPCLENQIMLPLLPTRYSLAIHIDMQHQSYVP